METKIYNDLGNKLKYFRKLHNKTQTDLANALDLSQATIAQYENGKKKMSIATLMLFAKFYNVSIVEMFGYDFIEKELEVFKYQKRLYDEFGAIELNDKEVDIIIELIKDIVKNK